MNWVRYLDIINIYEPGTLLGQQIELTPRSSTSVCDVPNAGVQFFWMKLTLPTA